LAQTLRNRLNFRRYLRVRQVSVGINENDAVTIAPAFGAGLRQKREEDNDEYLSLMARMPGKLLRLAAHRHRYSSAEPAPSL
jgi:hypothetical protein